MIKNVENLPHGLVNMNEVLMKGSDSRPMRLIMLPLISKHVARELYAREMKYHILERLTRAQFAGKCEQAQHPETDVFQRENIIKREFEENCRELAAWGLLVYLYS